MPNHTNAHAHHAQCTPTHACCVPRRYTEARRRAVPRVVYTRSRTLHACAHHVCAGHTVRHTRPFTGADFRSAG
eukprot:5500262-Pleurochrysis_carterae.AAC.1